MNKIIKGSVGGGKGRQSGRGAFVGGVSALSPRGATLAFFFLALAPLFTNLAQAFSANHGIAAVVYGQQHSTYN